MVTEITGKIIGFKQDGTMLIFDSKKEQVDYDYKKNQVSMLFASPRWILNRLRESEDKIEELEREVGVAKGEIDEY